jgi:hypothetical protein
MLAHVLRVEALCAPVIGSIRPEDRDIAAVSDMMRTMCASQRGEVLGYARRVAETSQAFGLSHHQTANEAVLFCHK